MSILPLTYFGPIGWWNILSQSDNCIFDIYENYVKQTYRNRCSILTANGVLNLSIPVKKVNGNHTAFKDVKIENNQHWQIIHYRATLSAYKASPFFDYYIDDIMPVWNKHYDFLLDVCIDSFNIVQNIISKKFNINLSESYIIASENDSDYRKDYDFNYPPVIQYNQVFSDRFNFIANLSILDQLFNDDSIYE